MYFNLIYHITWILCIQNLEDKIATANQTLHTDKRFGTNPLMLLLYRHQPSAIEGPHDMCNLHIFPDVWQYRPQVTIESLLQYLDRQHSGQKGESFVLLHEFLKRVFVFNQHNIQVLISVVQGVLKSNYPFLKLHVPKFKFLR